jgi:hypothetical protein
MLSAREIVEVFHLHFIRLLAASRERANCVVKGGGNLRFFFASPRHSEDLDLDVHGVPPHALEERVVGILGSRVFRETLATAGIDVDRITAPKQTATTQRWKVALRPHGGDILLHTKIEFSRREGEGPVALEAVDPGIARHYALLPVLAFHYLLPAAIRQKVGALIGRREVQARDVFDLSLLFARAGAEHERFDDLRPLVPAAIEKVFELSSADYVSQVVAYLEAEHAGMLGTPETWEAMQLQVATALERIGGRV